MASLSISQKSALDALLAKGEFEEASKFLAGLPSSPAAAAAAAEAAKPKGPRSPQTVILEAFKIFHALLGNNPSANEIMAELEAVLTPPAAADGAATE